jgi:hypothetical protein
MVRWQVIDSSPLLLPHSHSASTPPLGVHFVCNSHLLLHRALLLPLRVAGVRLLGVPASSGVRVRSIVVIAGWLSISKSGFLIAWCREGGVCDGVVPGDRGA